MKKLYRTLPLVFFFSAFLINQLFAQTTPAFQFALGAGGDSNQDFGNNIRIDSDGNFIVTGRMGGIVTFGDSTFSTVGVGDLGPMDMYVGKFNPSGNLLWLHHTGGVDQPGKTTVNVGHSIAIDKQNNIIATGTYGGTPTAFGPYVLPVVGPIQETFVVKYSPDGTILWANSITGANGVVGFGVITDHLNNVYVCGTFGHHNFNGSANFGNTTLNSVGGRDIFIAKYDENGNLIWARRAGASNLNNNDASVDIGIDSKENIYMCGYSGEGIVDFGNGVSYNSFSNRDIFVVKYNPQGVALWAQRAGGTGVDYGQKLKIDSHDNVYLTGSFQGNGSFGNTSLTSEGLGDIFVAKYDSLGGLIWAKRAGGAGDDWGYGIDLDSNNNVFLGGYFSQTANFDSNVLVSNGETDAFFSKYDSDGISEWAIQAGGQGKDLCNQVQVNSTGEIYAIGHFEQNIAFDTINLVSFGERDIFITSLGAAIPPLEVNAGLDSVICHGNSVQLGENLSVTGGTSPYIYSWSPTSSINDPSSPNPIATPSETTIYTLTVTDSKGNTSSDSITITISNINNDCIGLELGNCSFSIEDFTAAGAKEIVAINEATYANFKWYKRTYVIGIATGIREDGLAGAWEIHNDCSIKPIIRSFGKPIHRRRVFKMTSLLPNIRGIERKDKGWVYTPNAISEDGQFIYATAFNEDGITDKKGRTVEPGTTLNIQFKMGRPFFGRIFGIKGKILCENLISDGYGKNYFVIRCDDTLSSAKYRLAESLTSKSKPHNTIGIYPNPIRDKFTVSLPEEWLNYNDIQVKLISITGKELQIWKINSSNLNPNIDLHLNSSIAKKGINFVVVQSGKGGILQTKVLVE